MRYLHAGLPGGRQGAALDQVPNPTERQVRFWLAGNLCRCTGYDKIVRAVLQAAQVSGRTETAAASGDGQARTGGDGQADLQNR